MTYQHPPLKQSHDFRLVRLGTKPGLTLEPSITCELSHHSIDDPPAYYTLSYTWGNPDLDQEELALCTDNSSISIQPNLALWIRTHGLSLASQRHLFWIDQLCIDKSNTSERSQQVRMMKEIYARSSRLFVWLGPGSEESRITLQTIDRAGRVLHGIFQVPDHRALSSEEYYARGFPKPDKKAWGAVFDLFENPYFQRVWVQQEIVASKLYGVVLQCGEISIPWLGLEITAAGLMEGGSAINKEVFNVTVSSALQGSQIFLRPPAISGIAGFSNFRPTNPNSVHRTLYDVLTRFRGYQATDPRDMIFAPQAMQHDSGDSILVPDYNRTVEELYTLVSYFMLTKYGLNILCEAGF